MSHEVHIIAPFIFANGDDWHAIDLYLEYSKNHSVKLWSQRSAHQQLSAEYPIQEIRAFTGILPNNGILIISGTLTEIGQWYDHAQFEKVILIHNLLSPNLLYKALNRLTLNGKREVEIVYMSKLSRQLAGLPGQIIYHLPHPERFSLSTNNNLYKERNKFTIGRASADYLAKHHHADIKLYKNLVAQNMYVKILGGKCLSPWLSSHSNITLLPTKPQNEMAEFYQSLDCFHYRVPGVIKETYGLVVIEAMLSGLPVVCHQDIGATDLIQHGINGFVYTSTEQAIDIINLIKNDANLSKEIGISARLSLNKLQNSGNHNILQI